MTAFDFLSFLLSRQFHQQAGASILHLSFLFRDEGIYTWETVDGGVCSIHWTGLVALAWLDVDGVAAYGRSVVALQDTRFVHFLSLSLARELEYPLLSICIVLFDRFLLLPLAILMDSSLGMTLILIRRLRRLRDFQISFEEDFPNYMLSTF
jgi:hypothetical protein